MEDCSTHFGGVERTIASSAGEIPRRGLFFKTGLDRFPLLLLFVGVVIFPLPYGGITRIGTCIIEVIAFTVLALVWMRRPAMERLRGAGVPIAAILGVAVLGIVQVLPMPPRLLAAISPASARVYEQAADGLKLFGRPPLAARISIAPVETFDTVLLTLAYVALFVSAALLLKRRADRRQLMVVLLAGAALHVVVAASVGAFTHSTHVYANRLHGAFVNPNHFSAYLELMLCVAFVALWREILYARDRDAGIADRSAQFERRFMRISGLALLWGLFAAAIGLTQSRGGILAAAVTMCAMLTLGLLHRRVGRQRWAVGVIGGAALAAGLGFAALAVRQQPILRFLASDPRDPTRDLRTTLWRLSIDAWEQFPICGSGLGTFREAFRPVQPRSLQYLVEFAHSDPLQLLVTGGFLGLTLAGVAWAVYGARLFRRWSRVPGREESAIAMGGVGALFAITLHGLVEFNMSVPAIPATLAVISGLSWAATHDDEGRRPQLVDDRGDR